jgi:hypothetical protein
MCECQQVDLLESAETAPQVTPSAGMGQFIPNQHIDRSPGP